MVLQSLDISKNWRLGTVVQETNWDNIKDQVIVWADYMVNDVDQLRKDIFGTTYAYDNDGLANLSGPIRDFTTGVSSLAWVFSGSVTLPANTNLITPWISDSAGGQYYKFVVSDLAAHRTVTLPLLAGDDTFVFKDHAETLANKTLTTPVIASFYQDAGLTKLMTTPNTASDTLAAIAATQTLTNKTWSKGQMDQEVMAGSATVTVGKHSVMCTTAGITVTLPTAVVGLNGYRIMVKDTTGGADLSPITVVGEAAETVDNNAGGAVISTPYGSLTVEVYNSKWWIF